jgi:hypothetical protein
VGKGDGSLGTPVEYGPSVDLDMPKLEARDVTGEGVLDLIYLQGSPVVRAGRGDGSFGPAIYSYVTRAACSDTPSPSMTSIATACPTSQSVTPPADT